MDKITEKTIIFLPVSFFLYSPLILWHSSSSFYTFILPVILSYIYFLFCLQVEKTQKNFSLKKFLE